MKLSDFSVLSFDCYGTLIDWETGILTALRPWFDRHGHGESDDDILDLFGIHETAQQGETPTMLYPELLGAVMHKIGAERGMPVSKAGAAAFGATVPFWPAFPDSARALGYLKRHYKLVVLSNIDNESFEHASTKLGVIFDAVYTAEDIGSYKPAQANFDYLLKHLAEMGIKKGDILQTAQSLHHDHVPANANGIASAWIDRRAGRGGGAAKTPPGEVKLDFTFHSLDEMAEAHRTELPAA